MERCGFFDANLVGDEYDRVYLASQFAAYFASFVGNGVYAGKSNKLQVVSADAQGMVIKVLSGQGWINGYWYENTDNMNLSIDPADGVLSRIDIVVLRLDYFQREIRLLVKKGTPALSPTKPELERSADGYELQLAKVDVSKGITKITQSLITDTRLDKSVCGWVTGVIDQIDTTTLFNQYQTYFSEFKEIQEKAYVDWSEARKQDFNTWYQNNSTSWSQQFTAWFDNIKNQLSTDQAGHLQNQIDKLNEKTDGYFTDDVVFSDDEKVITQKLESGEKLITTFIDDFTILQEWFNASNIKVRQKRIKFSPDGKSIKGTKEVI